MSREGDLPIYNLRKIKVWVENPLPADRKCWKLGSNFLPVRVNEVRHSKAWNYHTHETRQLVFNCPFKRTVALLMFLEEVDCIFVSHEIGDNYALGRQNSFRAHFTPLEAKNHLTIYFKHKLDSICNDKAKDRVFCGFSCKNWRRHFPKYFYLAKNKWKRKATRKKLAIKPALISSRSKFAGAGEDAITSKTRNNETIRVSVHLPILQGGAKCEITQFRASSLISIKVRESPIFKRLFCGKSSHTNGEN